MNVNFKVVKPTMKVLLLVLLCNMISSALYSQISGVVFRDLNLNGTLDGFDTPESGIRIVAFNANGDSVAQSITTSANPNYSFTGLTLPVRLELRLPNYLFSSNGAQSRTAVEFFSASTTTANFGVHYPKLYCQQNPEIIIPTQVSGNPEGGSTGGSIMALARFPYTSNGTTTPPTTVTTASELGSIWGSTYQRESKKLILAEFLKRHSGLENLGLGGLFIVDLNIGTGTPSPYINVENFGIDLGSSTLGARNLPATATNSSADPNAFNLMGKIGMGAITLSDDGTVLWGVNLYTKEIFSFNIGNPIKAASSVSSGDFSSFAIPNPGCTNGVARPWAIHYYKNQVYVGVICSGETNGSQSDLFAYVYRFTPATSTWDASPLVTIPLNYDKGDVHTSYTTIDKWETWANTFTDIHDAGSAGTPAATRKMRPQPILSDIQFDKDGNMILAFMDRNGHLTGRNQVDPSGFGLYNGYVGGDLLYLAANGSGGFVLENNGSLITGASGSGIGNTQGPGGGEFFGGDFYDGVLTTGQPPVQIHQETAQGGIVYHPGRNEIVASHMDPLNVWTGGTMRHSLSNGYTHDTMRYEVYNTLTANGTFGKANGLGDVELLCNAAPIEIGNRVWKDTNKNGFQDPNETGINGVTVLLMNGATQVASTTTANGGQYYFTNANVTGGLSYNTSYTIKILLNQSALNQLEVSTADQNSNSADQIDSDGVLGTNEVLKTFTTGLAGQNNHSYDFGFQEVCKITAVATGTNVSCNGGNDGSASVTANGNFVPVTYLWSNGSTTQSISNLSAGTYSVTVTETPTCSTTASYTVTEPVLMNVVCAKSDVTTNGGTDGTANVSASGGTSPYTYLWSNGTTSSSISNLSAGTYSVTVSDSNGCTSTCSIIITQPSCNVVAVATGTNVLCNGGSDGSASVTASGNIAPVTYLWSNGATTQSISNLSAGTYSVTVTETPTCSTTASYTVTEPILMNVVCAKSDVTTNGGSDGSANVSASGGTSPYTYLWSNGATTSSISNLSAGTYSVTVSDSNGCTSTCSSIITQPSCNVIAVATGTNVLCNGGSDGSASVTASGNIAPVTYLWSNGTTSSSISNLSAGTYSVTVTETPTCSTTASYTVTEPVLINVVCAKSDVTTNGGSDGSANVSASGGTSPYTYLWSNGSTSSSISNLSAGTYSVTVSDSNGCTSICSSVVNEPGCNLSATTTGTNVTCNGGTNGSVSVTASGNIAPVTYLWSNGATTQSISNLIAGTYTVTVTETPTCSTTASYTVTEPVLMNVVCTKSDVTTNGGTDGTASVSASGGTSPYTYIWSNGATTSSISNLSSGTYSVTVSDSNGCTSICSSVVNAPGCNLSASTTGTNVTCNGGTNGSASVTASGNIAPVTYLWSNGATTQSISNLIAGIYTVTVTETPTCSTTASYTVTEPVLLNVVCTKSDVTTNGGTDGTASINASGGTSPYTYIWSNGATTSSISNLSSGTYSVTVSDSNGCTSICSSVVNAPGCNLSASTTGTNVTCNGGTNGSASVTASGNIASVTYLWSNGSTTQSISNLSAGTYSVTVTETPTCSTTASYTVTEPVLLNVVCTKSDVTTNGGTDGTASVSASGGTSPYTYLWSNGATTSSISNLNSGTYSVTVSDSNGCTSMCSSVVNAPGCNLSATTTGTNVTCNGGTNGAASVTASGNIAPVTYLWSNGATTQSISNLTAGTYTVTVTETPTCITTASYTVTEPSALNVACAKTDVTISGGNDGTVSVTATGGTSPYTYKWSNGATTSSIANLTAGTYSVTVNDANNCSATCSTIVNEPNVVYGSIGDYVWMDNNKDGIQDNTEPAVQGVILELYNANNLTTPIAKDTTDSNGHYLFSDLSAGDYIVKAVKTSFPTGKVITGSNNGTDDVDSDFDVSSGLSQIITLNPNNTGGNPLLKDNNSIDLGLYLPLVCPTTCSPVSVKKIR